jgi:hypothetical protein
VKKPKSKKLVFCRFTSKNNKTKEDAKGIKLGRKTECNLVGSNEDPGNSPTPEKWRYHQVE